MAVTANRTTVITLSGDLQASLSFPAAANAVAPGDIDIFTLASGANTISLPTGGTTVLAATILPPTANTNTITLKGVSGDTGIQLHKTNPSTVTFDAAAIPSSFILTVGSTITGLRIVWT